MTAWISAIRAVYAEFWRGRTPGERLTIAIGTAVLGIAICMWLMYTIERSRAQLRSAVVPALRERAGLLERQAAEYERLRAIPPASVSPTDIRALVQTQVGAAGLSKVLQNVEAVGPNQAKIVFGSIAFADWLNLVQSLDAQQVHLEACRIEALTAPGQVAVTGTLARAGQR